MTACIWSCVWRNQRRFTKSKPKRRFILHSQCTMGLWMYTMLSFEGQLTSTEIDRIYQQVPLQTNLEKPYAELGEWIRSLSNGLELKIERDRTTGGVSLFHWYDTIARETSKTLDLDALLQRKQQVDELNAKLAPIIGRSAALQLTWKLDTASSYGY